jgi:hypothetical protein
MSLQSAMDAAKQAANNLPATQEDNNQGGGAAVTPMQLGTGLDDFLSGGMNVDAWVQVKDAGIRLNRVEKAFLTEFEADLDLSSVQLFHGVRAEFAGNRVEYAKSFDGGRTTSRGESFAAVAAHYKANSLKPADPYRGADMVFILTDDVVQGKTTIPADTRLGYTTPITGFAPFQSLLKKLAAEGVVRDVGGGRLDGPRIRVKCTHNARENAAKQEYGVMIIELFDSE